MDYKFLMFKCVWSYVVSLSDPNTYQTDRVVIYD